jgi:predicted small lipoprotein YifL
MLMMTMKRIRQLSLTAMAVMFLAACGQKGPLFLPDNEPEKKQEKQEDTSDKARDEVSQ